MADVSKTHELYDQLIETWEMVRDCFNGSRGIKGTRRERYLPRLHKQSETEYIDYTKRAVFFNAVRRTVQAMIGFVFRQNPEVVVPNTPAMADFTKDCTLTGKSFYDYCKETVGAVDQVGGRGTLIDWQMEKDRAFIISYEREDIKNWRYDQIEGQSVLCLLVLHETSAQWIRLASTDEEPDEFETRLYDQYRVYSMEQDASGNYYVGVRVFRAKNQEPKPQQPSTQAQNAAQIPYEWVVVDQQVPMRGTTPLSRIPFVAHGAEINDLEPGIVPMESIAELNVAHYRNSADYENALHVAGNPTPVFTGFDFSDRSPNDGILMGSRKGIVSENTGAKAEFLTYSSSEASGIVEAMDKKEQQMSAQGARILEKQTSGHGTEAFQTVQLRQGADTSALMTITIASSASLSDVLQWVAWWNDRSVEQPEDLDPVLQDDGKTKKGVFVELNTEFIELIMDNAMLHELTASYLSGAISFETYFTKLQQGGIISSEKSQADEEQAIKDSPVNIPAPPAVGPDGKPLPTSPNPKAPAPKGKIPPKKKQSAAAA